jgi:hypothetical protein
VTLDSSVINAQGENYAVFFGDQGTTLAVPYTVKGRVAQTAAITSASDGGAGAAPAALESPGVLGVPGATLLWLLLAGGGGIVVLAAAGGGVLLLLRGRTPVG